MIDEKIVAYSLIPGIKKSQLKSWAYDHVDGSTLRAWMKNHGVFGCLHGDPNYHYKMASVAAAPYVYYGIGDHTVLNHPLLWIVGPRKMSQYAQRVLEKLFESLREYAIGTVSGMASWVDSLCHALSMQYAIPTVAIVWWWLWYLLKSTKRHVIESIVAHGGLVLSDFKLGQSPTPWSYPQRNRLIAWLGKCLFVPEAAQGSGSLITVDNTLALHKSVYGVPQWLFCCNSLWLLEYMSRGTVTVVADLRSFLETEFGAYKTSWVSTSRCAVDLTTKQQKLYEFLASHESTLDQLVDHLWWDISDLMSELTVLEMMGVVQETSSSYSVSV